MISLDNKVAVVTGSSRGIGKAIALKLARSGADLVINYSSDNNGAEETAVAVRDMGQRAITVQCNIADFNDAKNLIERSVDEYGKIDIMVNNAGITRDKLLLRMKEEDWDQVININLKGVFNCTRAVIRKMLKQSFGTIINISSVVGIMGNAGQSNYSASKAGIIGFTKSIAREVSSRGITVNAVAPGFIETDMTDELVDKVKDEMLKAIPLQRFGKPDDVANLVLFLASDLSTYINGQVINVDGGMLM